MGGRGASLEAALAYSNVVFAGNVLVWLMNALASVIRGTGNMLVPSLAVCLGVVLLVPLSPLLIFGYGPVPALGIAGGGVAVVLTTALTAARARPGTSCPAAASCELRLRALRAALFADILRVGARRRDQHLADHADRGADHRAGRRAGGPDAVAGYGTGARLEYLLIPLVFGLGAPMVALVGTNIGAGQQQRALRIALTGGAVAFAMTEAVGVAAAIWPQAWLGLFGNDPRMLETGDRLSAHRRSHIRLLRPRPVALFRLAGRRPAALAAARRPAAPGHRGRRRLAGALR